MNELIEYSGIDKYIPRDVLSFREINVESLIVLNKQTEKVKELVKVTVQPKIINYRMVKTPVGKSLEGQVLTGKKYVIQGELKIRIDYLNEDDGNKIYYKYYKQSFYTSIVVHKDLLDISRLIPSIFIENINVELLECNELFVITTIFATIEK